MRNLSRREALVEIEIIPKAFSGNHHMAGFCRSIIEKSEFAHFES